MRRIYYLLILLTFLYINACIHSLNANSTNIKDSLVYIRGEDSNQQDILSSATGFLIAREDSLIGTNKKYFILTAKHSVENFRKDIKFKAIPFQLAQIYLPLKGEWNGKNIIYERDKEDINMDLFVNLDDIDVSIMTFNADQELPIAIVSSQQPLLLKKLSMHGFIRCVMHDSQNKKFSYYTTTGELADLKYINRAEKEEDRKQELLRKLEIADREHEDDKGGIDLRYSNPSRAGMSGSPITIHVESNKTIVVGIQTNKLKNNDEPNTCALDPQTPYSYGISIKKILSSKNFPDSVKKLMKIEMSALGN